MIDTKAIRNKILDLAIRGKLTEQLPEDGTAEELYQQIQEEKQALIKSGKIKKEKPLPEIAETEIPFEIPENWKWSYLGDLFQHNTGKALNAKDTQGQMLEYITTSNLYWDHFELKELKKMPFTDEEAEKCTVKKGDLLVCEGGDIGRSAIWPFDYEMRIQNHIHRLRKIGDGICTKYYYYLLLIYKQTGRINGIGIGLQGFSSKRVHSLVVPLLPLAEQKRIVEKIEQAFSVLDSIDELQAKYADNLTVLKSKLIDLAIRGKLTEQFPEDGTAEELYQQIQEEKQALIKSGKIKKEKPLPEIAETEIPFEIPNNWKWVRLGDLTSIISKGTTPRGGNAFYVEKGIGFLRAENLNGFDKLNLNNLKHIDNKTHEGFLKRSILDDGDILISIAGTLGRTGLVRKENLPLNTNQAVAFIRAVNKKLLDLRYTVFTLNATSIQKMMDYKKVEMAIPNLSLTVISNVIIPLPPLAEQKRIVDRLDKLLAVCDEMKVK